MKLPQIRSIQTKLMISMSFCLLLFATATSIFVIRQVDDAMRDRMINHELPATIGEIRNDIKHHIGEFVANAHGIASNNYVLDWERSGHPASETDGWKRYALAVKEHSKAVGIAWISQQDSTYFDETGLVRTMDRHDPQQKWFYDFVDSKKQYTINIDRSKQTSSYIAYVTSRFDAGNGRVGLASLAYPIDDMVDMIRHYRIGANGFVYLVRQDGTILLHPDSKLADGRHTLHTLPGYGGALSTTLLARQNATQAILNGPLGSRMIASSYIPELDLYIIADASESEFLGETRRATIAATAIGTAAGAGVGVLLLIFVSRAIAAPIRRTATLLDDIANGNGDLTKRMPVESGDEIGTLAKSFNRFTEALSEIIASVRTGAIAIAQASSEVSRGNQDFSARTEDQAACLQQTALTMVELTNVVRQSASNAAQVSNLARSSSQRATRGGAVVGEAVKTMESIRTASYKMLDIIGVIDSIAFQTNILALNAAVEAARAGEHGHGFAIVASEVRTLARRSASAAGDIKKLIHNSVEQIAAGGELVNHAGLAMEEIVRSVESVARLTEEIATGTSEQCASITQLNQVVMQLDDTTQQNAALVEEAAAASESLQDQAAQLERIVGVFRIAECPIRAVSSPFPRQLLQNDPIEKHVSHTMQKVT